MCIYTPCGDVLESTSKRVCAHFFFVYRAHLLLSVLVCVCVCVSACFFFRPFAINSKYACVSAYGLCRRRMCEEETSFVFSGTVVLLLSGK